MQQLGGGFEVQDVAGVVFDNQQDAFAALTDAPVAGKVALLSGGGSGHEPMHCGYIGQGMLSGSFSTSSTRLISFFIIQCSVGEGSMRPLCWRRRSSRFLSKNVP
jgi:hypothetical protein